MRADLPMFEDLEEAIRGLTAEGATEIYVYGSVAEDRVREHSDLDLAVRGRS